MEAAGAHDAGPGETGKSRRRWIGAADSLLGLSGPGRQAGTIYEP